MSIFDDFRYRRRRTLYPLTFCYTILMMAAWLTFGSILIHSGKRIEKHSLQGTAFVKQLA